MSTPQLAVEPIEEETEGVTKKAITNHSVLNEAFDYAKPSSFSRGLRLDIKGVTILLISGTASIDENGKTVHEGDFRAQTLRTYQNITGLLASEGATWKDWNACSHCRCTELPSQVRSGAMSPPRSLMVWQLKQARSVMSCPALPAGW